MGEKGKGSRVASHGERLYDAASNTSRWKMKAEPDLDYMECIARVLWNRFAPDDFSMDDIDTDPLGDDYRISVTEVVEALKESGFEVVMSADVDRERDQFSSGVNL